ncbi:FGGY-family carbohydrate kinase [Phycicoccus duodecadis]|uniref:FGGY-family carbohydrate kinase n=1 Tax=Phycicoccus duodecadis TaxID=173053 RepID=UPI000C70EFE4|nr:FGGY-family carbohydrate kinase [Phycicoccus duodecadis]
MSLVLGVDIGTASTKAVAVDEDGAVVARVERAHRTATPRPGWFEHDATNVWWKDLTECLTELLPQLGEAPVALGVSGIGPCLLPTDAQSRPLRPAILYGVDTRAGEQVRAMSQELGEDAIAATGAVLTSQAVGPKMRWLAEHEPEVWARTRRFFMASSFLVNRLTGAYVLDHHSASQCAPLYDQTTCDWDQDRWAAIAGHLEMPALHWSDEVVGAVSDEAAALTGLPAGIPVTAGTIDAWAEAESVQVARPGDVMVMYGSTMFLVALTDTFTPSRSLWPTTGVRPDVRCLAAGMATSGSVTEWISDLVSQDYATLTENARAVPPGSDGLLVLPYFAGERTPLFDPGARGVISGLSLRHRAGHLYRAALEGVAFGVRHNLEAMRQAGARVERLVAVGGGTTGGLWTQIVSDVTGLPQDLARTSVGAAYGDAMLAAVASGLVTESATRTWNPVVRQVRPDPATRGLYDTGYAAYRELYETTRPLVGRWSLATGSS